MTARRITRKPNEETRARQAQATEPGLFAWVSANAGSGKTTVLVRRIQRLLLSGVEPPQILCLTYTEAAAANMKNRLLAELSDWVGKSEAELTDLLAPLLRRPVTPADRIRARELFAVALQSPGGLKIGTIHGFCTRILQIAPFEANVPSRFEVLDETAAGLLMAEALDQVLARAACDADLAASLAIIGEEVGGEDGLAGLIRETALRRHAFLDEAGEPVPADTCKRRAALALGIDADASREAVIADTLARLPTPQVLRQWAANLAPRPLVTDTKTAARLYKVAGAASDEQAFEAWQDIALDSKGIVKAKFLTAATVKLYPEIEASLISLAVSIDAAAQRVRAIETLRRSVALHVVMGAVFKAYERRKLARRALDFADLIAETRSLVSRVEAGWLLYKLDAEISHLMVDEAQDTSLVQWDIIQNLTREFTAGIGVRQASDPVRTVFAVGDEKQSIYSFQGAQPDAFDASRRHYARVVHEAGLDFEEIRLNQSFRSARPIIDLVDQVFATPERWQGLSALEGEPPQRHDTARGDDLGAVELWDLVLPDEAPEREAWDAPPDTTGTPAAILARRIARTLADWMGAGRDDLGRTFMPGDVLILLRSRNALFREIIRALRVAQVPVAGVDRLDLTRHIAVQDLIVIGEALLLPEDDLTLATALKTPIFGLDDHDLLQLTEDRTGSLIAALRQAEAPGLRAAAQLHDSLANLRHELGPHAFYAELLGRGGGYRRMVARLGTEAGDALDAFLSAALEHEMRHGPALASFLAEMRMSQRQIKRDLAEPRGEVRVMTVHGAKGLEAPIVILPDTGATRPRYPSLRVMSVSEAGRHHEVPLWVRSTSEQETQVTAQARNDEQNRAEAERNRLLYVALTRAEDRLIVTGLGAKPNAKTGETLPENTWYRRIEAGFVVFGDSIDTVPGPDGSTIRRVAKGVLREEAAAPMPARIVPITEPEPWLNAPARVEMEPAPPIAASSPLGSADDDEPTAGGMMSAGIDQPAQRQRGLLAHLLLQHLPAVEPERRQAAAGRLAASAGSIMSPEAIARVIGDVLPLFVHPELAELFGPDSLAEVPIAGPVALDNGQQRQADGRIDRLVVTAETVLFADFKTTPVTPDSAEQVPEAVMRQMAIYAALLRTAFPARQVTGLIIYTSGPRLIWLEPQRLAATPIRASAPFKAA